MRGPKFVIPIQVTGPETFVLVAIWTQGARPMFDKPSLPPILTLDRDFGVYRKNGRQVIDLLCPW